MADPIVKLENISKRYQIYHEMQSAYSTLVETLSSKARNAVDYVRSVVTKQPPSNNSLIPEEFYALKDVNFEINQGDCVGIIGKNGAGKSTLLKIMSRIVTPTTGTMTMRGRLASLLEVGTGFHQELTGRENIYLNGSLLGMRTKDIRARFDEIVAFSGVEKFLDTPVKRYSSGMYTRLGFSIAAHLDPDILIVDEVLAVGDFAFQQKCLQKLDRLGSEGTTIIFVSHDVNSVIKLCSRAIYLENGKVEMIGKAEECALAYMKQHNILKNEWQGHNQFFALSIKSARFLNLPRDRDYFEQEDIAEIGIEYELHAPDSSLYMQIEVVDARGQQIASSRTVDSKEILLHEQPCKLAFKLDTSLLYPGEYTVKIKPCKIGHPGGNETCIRLVIYAKKNQLTLSEAVWGIKFKNAWNKG